jgi:hypothetical protein
VVEVGRHTSGFKLRAKLENLIYFYKLWAVKLSSPVYDLGKHDISHPNAYSK